MIFAVYRNDSGAVIGRKISGFNATPEANSITFMLGKGGMYTTNGPFAIYVDGTEILRQGQWLPMPPEPNF